ncbi:MAG: acetyltransferase, partial [Prevotella sp.]|nr:acetyltransferase [Prevotella sp.]
MKDLGYKIVYAVFYVMSLLPLRVMYVMSDLLFPIAYYVVRYRRHIVRSNLQTSFPEKSPAEILHIETRFYHWFLDYFFETIKLLTISSERLLQHLE